MSGLHFQNNQHPKKKRHNYSRFLLFTALSILAVLAGLSVATALTSGSQGEAHQKGEATSNLKSSQDPIWEMKDANKEQSLVKSDTVVLVNSYDELDIGTPGAISNPLLPKTIRGSSSNRARWTPTPLPTSTPVPTPSPAPTFVGELPTAGIEFPSGIEAGEKWIDVNLTTQTLVAYEGIKPVFQSLVSSGTAKNPTVTGQFRIWLRFASQDMNGYRLGYDYFLQDVPYVQYFFEDYALHGTFWHNNFGTPMSHGCVNLPTPAAEWLFNWASNGTLVNVHS
jgi:lipoprotein-anchoring transpeptidase ErfK/SrfK